MTAVIETTSLLNLAKGHKGRITEICGDHQMQRRMMSMGFRVGTVVDVLNHRGRDVVVGNGGTRVALGSTVAEKLIVETLS